MCETLKCFFLFLIIITSINFINQGVVPLLFLFQLQSYLLQSSQHPLCLQWAYISSSMLTLRISFSPLINHFFSTSLFLNAIFSDGSSWFPPSLFSFSWMSWVSSFSSSSKSYFFTFSGTATHPLTGFIYISILLKLIFQIRFLKTLKFHLILRHASLSISQPLLSI